MLLCALQINLRLILVSGKTKEFLFSPSDSAGDIAHHVFENWPEGELIIAVSKPRSRQSIPLALISLPLQWALACDAPRATINHRCIQRIGTTKSRRVRRTMTLSAFFFFFFFWWGGGVLCVFVYWVCCRGLVFLENLTNEQDVRRCSTVYTN
jgi:hypothetical protein